MTTLISSEAHKGIALWNSFNELKRSDPFNLSVNYSYYYVKYSQEKNGRIRSGGFLRIFSVAFLLFLAPAGPIS